MKSKNIYTIGELLEGYIDLIPEASGIYWVLVPPNFDFTLTTKVNYPQVFPKYKDKIIPIETLEKRLENYINGSSNIIYIGQATNLKNRIEQLIYFEYHQYIKKSTLPHYGGRAIWQLAHNKDLYVKYLEYDKNLDDIETKLIDQYILDHDPINKKNKPFANENRGQKMYRLFD